VNQYERVHRKRLTLTGDYIPPMQGGEALEVGHCGFFDAILEARGYHVCGANWNANEPTGPFNFDAEGRWPHDDGMYDLVIACEILEHLPNDPMALFAEANRVLKPGGQILLTTPNIASSRGVEALLQGFQPYLFCSFPRSPRDRHVIEFDRHQLALMLHCAGFEPNVWTENCWSEPNPTAMDVLKRHGFPTEHRGDNLFTLSRKIGPVLNRKPDGIYHD
jgi:SAM-dependent methyltransferase